MNELQRFHRALIPLDGSAAAELALPTFLEIVRALNLELILLQVVPYVPPQVTEGTRHVLNPMERLEQHAEDYLARQAADLRARGLSVRTAVRTGNAAEEIVEAAREHQADLIAMTTHGRTGLSRLFFGSVAEAVLRHAHVPVFLVRSTEAEAGRRAA